MIERAFYHNDIPTFLTASQSEILGELTKKSHFALEIMQRNAWVEQIANLKEQLRKFQEGDIFFEFAIPRMGKRVDAVLLAGGVVFVIEFKIGAMGYDKHAVEQVVDYALDLKNFHDGSHDKYLVPILVSTRATKEINHVEWAEDHVAEPLLSNGDNLDEIIKQVFCNTPVQPPIDARKWTHSGYKPTPTIVEAAEALYREHSVEEISRADAGVTNLTQTSRCISDIVEFSKTNRRKSICFVTGVPGAGKTLAGLNIATTQRCGAAREEYAVFLSGNGPLVAVLREALARDQVARAKEKGQTNSKKSAERSIHAFIQNIFHFRSEALQSDRAPEEYVLIFDEAQRAWNQKHTEKFMREKWMMSRFDMSEPEFLISVMDRKKDWCTIICLIGGGQEINTGEAGLIEWFDALQKRFSHWDVYYSDQITSEDYSWGQDLRSKLVALQSQEKAALHLAVSVRSYRAEKLSAFVGAVIKGDVYIARQLYRAIQRDYSIALTRDIGQVREWLREKARGTERYGLVASSGAIRLKPEGISVKTSIDPVTWFLNDKDDVRSSYYLEDAATEFDIQGLELDWTGVCWDADFRRENNAWGLYAFKGTKWQNVNDSFRQVYLPNAYRVLLTRARQGMVLFVPRGDEKDYTRPPSFYDETYDFLASCGIGKI